MQKVFTPLLVALAIFAMLIVDNTVKLIIGRYT